MKADILEIIQQYKLGHIHEEQTIKELCDLFSFSKHFFVCEDINYLNKMKVISIEFLHGKMLIVLGKL